MFFFKAIFTGITLMLLVRKYFVLSEPIRNNNKYGNINIGNNWNKIDSVLCEKKLCKTRRFLLHAILSFEDVCESYRLQHSLILSSKPSFGNTYRHLSLYLNEQETEKRQFMHKFGTPDGRSEVLASFKLLMVHFNDIKFTNIIHDAVIKRCRIKYRLQHGEKRNSVVLGKKQRFHSWGGKRAQSCVPKTCDGKK